MTPFVMLQLHAVIALTTGLVIAGLRQYADSLRAGSSGSDSGEPDG